MYSGSQSPYQLSLDHPPHRVVSLVPSLTESLFELGLGEVVGVTDYCIAPEDALIEIPRLGGTKNPRLEDILALEPDIVLANQEENSRSTVEALQAAGIPVWLSFPKSVQQALDDLWFLAGLFQNSAAASRLKTLAMAVDWARSAASSSPGERYFCPIWQQGGEQKIDWWMTFNQDTYSNDLLALFGWVNVFADRQRSYPLAADLRQSPAELAGDRDVRYPRVTAAEIKQVNPDLILLPSEPYPFGEGDIPQLMADLQNTAAVRNKRIILVDGTLITWHGIRLGRALRELPAILSS